MALDFDDRARRPGEPDDPGATEEIGALSEPVGAERDDARDDDPQATEAIAPVQPPEPPEPPQPPAPVAEPVPEATPYETVEHEAAVVPPPREDELAALREATFPVVWRGYDVAAVDAYVADVEELIARFEERTSPTVAVQRALDRVGEQTAAILRQAEQSAEETTRASRAKADDRLQRAEREAAELHAEAVAKVRALDDDVERLWQERQRLIDATKELSEQLRSIAADAESRFPPAAAPEEEPPADEDEPGPAPLA